MNHFPETLKTWRKARRLSQLDLSLEADVSSRHISFLETGRAQPSREMISRLSEALSLPLATRNIMMANAGYAPTYVKRSWDAEEMVPIRMALSHTLTNHAPYPAFAIDRMWTIFQMNGIAKQLFGMLGVTVGHSLVELLLSETLPNFVENWSEVAHHSALRLRTESAAQGGIRMFDEAAEQLAQIPYQSSERSGPVVPAIYKVGDLRLSLFTTIAQFGTPEDITLDDLKIELFFPANAETDDLLHSMANSKVTCQRAIVVKGSHRDELAFQHFEDAGKISFAFTTFNKCFVKF
jgi:transcriptional regulator with XRE-family HTH domain